MRRSKSIKTQLTEQEINFYNALCENMKEHEDKKSDYYYLNILGKASPIKNKNYEEIDFAFDLKSKIKFIDDSVLLFAAINSIYIGKLGDWFWMINECENVYFISKSMIDITNCLLSENCFLRINNLDTFYYINQKHYDIGDYKDYLEEYRLFAKQHGYNFDLLKDVDDYEGIEEDIEEFNNLLASYGIVNEKE